MEASVGANIRHYRAEGMHHLLRDGSLPEFAFDEVRRRGRDRYVTDVDVDFLGSPDVSTRIPIATSQPSSSKKPAHHLLKGAPIGRLVVKDLHKNRCAG